MNGLVRGTTGPPAAQIVRRHAASLVAWLAWLLAPAPLLVAPAALLAAPAAGAQERSLEETLDDAVQSYTRGLNGEARDARLAEFRRAERLFANLEARGVSTADLYTNLGNAALQAEDLGAAVLAYRRALRLDADHPRALQNLDHARSLLPAWVPRPAPSGVLDSLFFWHRTVPEPLRELLAAACFAAAALLVAASIRLRQTVLRNAAVLPGLAWLAITGSVLLDPASGDPTAAVVTASETVARAADSGLAPSAFPQPLPGGVELRILEARPPWVRVRLANGRDAWVSESSVTRVAEDEG